VLAAAVLVFRRLNEEMSLCISTVVFVIGSDLSFLNFNTVGVKWLLRVWTNEVNNSPIGVGCSSCAWVSSQVKRDNGDVRTRLRREI